MFVSSTIFNLSSIYGEDTCLCVFDLIWWSPDFLANDILLFFYIWEFKGEWFSGLEIYLPGEREANIYWGRNGEHFLIELGLFISCLHSGMAQMDIHSLLLAHRQENETLPWSLFEQIFMKHLVDASHSLTITVLWWSKCDACLPGGCVLG